MDIKQGDIKGADLTKGKIRYFRGRLSNWAKDNTRDFPWRGTTDPYKTCVAEIMLHQTVANRVAPVYEDFIHRYPDIKSLSLADVRTLKKAIHSLGFLYRAERLKEMAQAVIDLHGGEMPSDKKGIQSLPGIGEYTASAIICFAYGEQVPIIDANVVRLYTRFFGLTGKLPSSAPTVGLREVAAKALPRGRAREYNYAVLDFAAAVCTHYNPGCSTCPLAGRCHYHTNITTAP